ncbi:MAG: thioredoxin domain-containing protein [Polyangiaceae bacterium]
MFSAQRSSFLAALVTGAFALGACSLGLSPRAERTSNVDEQPGKVDQESTQKAQAVAPRRDIDGIDTADLDERGKQAVWELVSTMYAPCKEQAVTVAECVEQARPCSACKPMANLLAEQIRRGVPKTNAAAAATVRFGPDDVIKVDERDSPAVGPESAPVRIVVFSDFQCPACRATIPVLEAAQKKHDASVRLVHKFFPLDKHPRAKDCAFAAVAAMNQGKFWEMERLLFDNQMSVTDEDLRSFAKSLSLDLDRFDSDRKSAATAAIVERDIADGVATKLHHTPWVLINGRVFDTAYFKYDRDLDEWIDTEAQLAKKR